jgi:catalase
LATAFVGAPTGAVAPLRGLRVAILIGDGSDEAAVAAMQKALRAIGARTELVGGRDGVIATSRGTHRPERAVSNVGPEEFDAVFVPGGDASALAAEPRAVDFVAGACRDAKPVAAVGRGRDVVEASGAASRFLFRGDDAQLMRVARELVTALVAGPNRAAQPAEPQPA